VFYVAHRLFAAHDRALGALVASRLADETGPGSVFLPFSDTNEEELVADNKGRRLFELDRQRLADLSGMLTVLHGPSLDDGVCMELGYAAALCAPIVALTTDFITHGLNHIGPELAFPDPLIETLVTEIVRLDKLGTSASTSSNRFDDFRSRNNSQLTAAVDEAVSRLLQLAHTVGTVRTTRSRLRSGHQPVAFCEPSPYWTDPSWEWVTTELNTLGYGVHPAERLSAPDPRSAADADWAALRDADLLIVDVSGPEAPPGAAALIGAAAALGLRVLAHTGRRSWTFATGREPNWRNLMIQYAVHDQFTDLPTLRRALSA
jgi:nucleoside 2-deoxyribosyltransferase